MGYIKLLPGFELVYAKLSIKANVYYFVLRIIWSVYQRSRFLHFLFFLFRTLLASCLSFALAIQWSAELKTHGEPGCFGLNWASFLIIYVAITSYAILVQRVVNYCISRNHEYSWICFWKAFLNIPDQGSPCNLFCFSPCCTMHCTCFMMTYFLHKKNEETSLSQYYVTTSGTVLINSIWYQEHLAISRCCVKWWRIRNT